LAKLNDAQGHLSMSDRATLDLLDALEQDSAPSQRNLAKKIGIALGLTNGILKRAVRKGLVKIRSAPAKRYAYYVTPSGFAEKSRLVAEYLSTSLSFFRQAREEYEDLFSTLAAKGCKKAVLFGTGELAEIAILSARQEDFEVAGVIDVGGNQSQFVGLQIFPSVQSALDAGNRDIVITDSVTPQAAYDELTATVGPNHVHVVPLLRARRRMEG